MPDFAPPQYLVDALSESAQEAKNNQYTRSQVCSNIAEPTTILYYTSSLGGGGGGVLFKLY